MTANLCQNQTNNFNLVQKHRVFNKNRMRVYIRCLKIRDCSTRMDGYFNQLLSKLAISVRFVV